MNKRILIRFVPPAPIKVPNGPKSTRLRTWKVDKLIGFLQEGLEPMMGEAYPDVEFEVVEARAQEIRFDGWKPEKPGDVRKAIGEMMGNVMEGIEAEEYLED
ncbi:hypothetical protein [Deinococcus hopiensis]|uniref:Uncharacterized protein n=1 Tax=Deinococcus hopiensis KR-140 TaxID=695939 RepID=A0A1W1V7B0_9DEIO|nr:hypothetical protein [Deinococcus hopiensis]SMB89248.1 hypothetical protein SAMN00790413_00328 [Deinococcus hopiensis KR-140]